MLGGYLLLSRSQPPISSNGKQGGERRESGVSPTLSSLGLWPGKWGKGRRKRSSSSWNHREPELSCPAALKFLQEAAAQIHNVLPNPRPFIQLRQDRLPIFFCVRVHVKTLQCVNPRAESMCACLQLGACGCVNPDGGGGR